MKYFEKKWKLLVIVVFSFLYNLLSVIFAFFLMKITDAIISGKMNDFIAHTGYGFVCLILQISVYIFQSKYTNDYVAECMIFLKNNLVKGISKFTFCYYAESKVEEYQSFFQNDLKLFEKQYYRQIIDLLSSISLLIVSILGIAYIHPVFLIALLLIVIIALMLPMVFKNTVLNANVNYTTRLKEYLEALNELLYGFHTVKNYNISKQITDRISEKNSQLEQSHAQFDTKITIINSLMAFVGQILVLISFALGGYLSVEGRITTGSIVALSQLLAYAVEPISVIASTMTSLNAIQNVKDDCDHIINYHNSEGQLSLRSIPHSIELKSVSFSYDGDRTILKDASAVFETPYKYAVLGKNGTGKSTLLKLIMKMISNYNGTITVDGVNICSIPESEYFKYITYLPQSPFIFNMTFEDNVEMFQEQIDKSIEEKLVFNLNLEHLKDVVISSNEVSGGEKSKIAIMRSLLKQSPIILMDEPTAAMDENSNRIFDDLLREFQDKLFIVITHRIDDSLTAYDRYVIIDEKTIFITENLNEALTILGKEGVNDD